MTPLRRASLLSMSAGSVELQLERGWRARVSMVAGDIGRFTLLPPEGWREPRTWALDPAGTFPLEGRRRDEVYAPDASAAATQDGAALVLSGASLRARIALEPFAVSWEQRDAQGAWQFCCGDRDESYAYATSARSGTLYHWQKRDPAHTATSASATRPDRSIWRAGACARASWMRSATTPRRATRCTSIGPSS